MNSVVYIFSRPCPSVRFRLSNSALDTTRLFGVPKYIILVICQFYAGMRACSRLNYEMCVLAPHVFNILLVAVINVAYTHFKANKVIMDALVHLRKTKGEQSPEGQPW